MLSSQSRSRPVAVAAPTSHAETHAQRAALEAAAALTTKPPSTFTTPGTGSTAGLSDGSKATLCVLNFHGLERDKPLIGSHFIFAYTQAGKTAAASGHGSGGQETAGVVTVLSIAPHPPHTPVSVGSPTAANGTSSNSANNTSARGPRGREWAYSNASTDWPAAASAALGPPPCRNFLQLTPSTKEKERRSTRSGRVLSESESLQMKHNDEYTFILPVVGHALSQTIAAHEAIRKEDESFRLGRSDLSPSFQSVGMGHSDSGGDGADFNTSDDDDDGKEDEEAYEGEEEEEDGSELGSRSGDDEATWAERRAAQQQRRQRRQRRERKKALAVGPDCMAPFFASRGPEMSPPDFLRRLVKYTFSSPSSHIAACFYIDRLLTRHPSLLLVKGNFLKLFLLAVRIASKYFDTRTLNNKDFALVGGVKTAELNNLEVSFLEGIGFELYISPEEFYTYAFDLVNAALGGSQYVKYDVLPRSPFAVASTLPSCFLHEASPEADSLTTPQAAGSSSASVLTLGSARLDGRVLRSSRRASIVGVSGGVFPVAERRARSLSLASNNSQSGMLPALRSASRPALPPGDSTADLASLRGSFAMDGTLADSDDDTSTRGGGGGISRVLQLCVEDGDGVAHAGHEAEQEEEGEEGEGEVAAGRNPRVPQPPAAAAAAAATIDAGSSTRPNLVGPFAKDGPVDVPAGDLAVAGASTAAAEQVPSRVCSTQYTRSGRRASIVVQEPQPPPTVLSSSGNGMGGATQVRTPAPAQRAAPIAAAAKAGPAKRSGSAGSDTAAPASGAGSSRTSSAGSRWKDLQNSVTGGGGPSSGRSHSNIKK